MHLRLLAVFYWLLAGIATVAQADSSLVVVPKNEWCIKASPLAVFEPDGGIGLSGEYLLVKAKLGLQVQVQPILFDIYLSSSKNGWEAPVNTIHTAMPLGIKLRPEIRYYLEGVQSRKHHTKILHQANGKMVQKEPETRVYIAVDFLFKKTWKERLGSFSINNGGVVPAFQQNVTYKDIKTVMGLDLKFGVIFPISKNNAWFIEAFFGAGYRSKKFSYSELPAGALTPSRRRILQIFGNRDAQNQLGWRREGISLPVGLNLVYRLK